jgi:hypothetical protein
LWGGEAKHGISLRGIAARNHHNSFELLKHIPPLSEKKFLDIQEFQWAKWLV